MFLRATLTAAVLLAGAPALASSDLGTPGGIQRAEKNATTRCMMRQLHTPAGRGIGGTEGNCTQVARAEVAVLTRQHEQRALASRELPANQGVD